MRRSLFFALLMACAVSTRAAAWATGTDTGVAQSVSLPDIDSVRGLLFDDSTRRLYVASAGKVSVFDGALTLKAELAGADVRGMALALPLRRGYFVNGADNTLSVFNPGSNRVLAHIALSIKAVDRVVFEPRTTQLVAFGAGSAELVDAASDMPEDTITLPAPVQGAVTDGTGRIFLTLAKTDEIYILDARRGVVTERWSLGSACHDPRALALDDIRRHLFVACGNGQIVSLDSDYGAVETSIDAPAGLGGMAYDPGLNLMFVLAGKNLLTFGPGAGGRYGILNTVPVTDRPGMDNSDAGLLALDAGRHALITALPGTDGGGATLQIMSPSTDTAP